MHSEYEVFDLLYDEYAIIDSLNEGMRSFEWFILEGLILFCEVGTSISYLPAHYSLYDMEPIWEPAVWCGYHNRSCIDISLFF